jgi:hypothetical protein
VAAGKYPRIAACFQPPGALARARVYFRAGGTADWFYVEMGGAPPCLEATLPRPKKSAGRIEYYVAATDRYFAERRTGERAMAVTTDGRCSAGPVAPSVDTASVVIGSISGAAPEGFVTGAALSPLLVAGGVAVVVGGAAALVAGRGGEESPPTPPTTTAAITFPGATPSGPAATGAWASTLSVPDGCGQVVVDDAQAVFPGPGTEAFSAPARASAHRFEATLVGGGSRPGTWRFDLVALGVAPGTLRVVAGEAVLAGPSSIAFRLRGEPGERVVFTFETAPEPAFETAPEP